MIQAALHVPHAPEENAALEPSSEGVDPSYFLDIPDVR